VARLAFVGHPITSLKALFASVQLSILDLLALHSILLAGFLVQLTLGVVQGPGISTIDHNAQRGTPLDGFRRRANIQRSITRHVLARILALPRSMLKTRLDGTVGTKYIIANQNLCARNFAIVVAFILKANLKCFECGTRLRAEQIAIELASRTSQCGSADRPKTDIDANSVFALLSLRTTAYFSAAIIYSTSRTYRVAAVQNGPIQTSIITVVRPIRILDATVGAIANPTDYGRRRGRLRRGLGSCGLRRDRRQRT
jgi:hypothetical protein